MTDEIKTPIYFLLVDDLKENLLALEALLKRDGLVLLKARSGAQALELLLEHETALALIDVQMPNMDGFELAELMRGTERTRRVPIIFLTAGNADLQRRFRGYEAGAVDFLNKPIEPDVLRSKAQVFFQLARQRQQIAQQRDHLQEKAAENARLLNESRMNAELLRQASQNKDEFLATLSHELRNPLSSISNGIEILQRRPHDEQEKNLHELMKRQLFHLIRLIDDLMDVARVSQGKIELRKQPMPLQEAIRLALESSQQQVDKAGHHLTIDLPPEPVYVDADLTRLAQLVGNLINNATKYTPTGGAIRVQARREGQHAILTVQDNGIGIDRAMIPHVFDLFTQAPETTQGGLGIGLALSRKIAELHGGTVRVQSEGRGKGSTFTLQLPLAAEAPRETSAAAPDVHEQGRSGLRILIVDDNLPAAQTTGWMVELIGHEPALAHDGASALAQADTLRPDVILLDIGLPDMSGYDVCRQMRANPELAHTLIIAQTGWGQEKDRRMAAAAGFDYHLTKPVELEKLSALLDKLPPAAVAQ